MTIAPSPLVLTRRQCAARVIREAKRTDTIGDLVNSYVLAVSAATSVRPNLWDCVDELSTAQREAFAAQAERLAGCCGGMR